MILCLTLLLNWNVIVARSTFTTSLGFFHISFSFRFIHAKNKTIIYFGLTWWIFLLGSSSLHRSPQAEGVPAPHHLPEEPPQVCPDWGWGEEDLHAEVHQDRRQGPHRRHLPNWIHGCVSASICPFAIMSLKKCYSAVLHHGAMMTVD